MPPAIAEMVDTLKQRAEAKLANADIAQRRIASAELNGIYGIYQNQLTQGQQDIHYLIATDTYQGLTTAQIVENFLRNQGIVNVTTYTPPGLTTASSQAFAWGIDELLEWLENNLRPLQEQSHYQINFNLVGGFKALQGYLNTLGMFYADELTYIFEGTNNLISIPRLPIDIDSKAIAPHVALMARLAANTPISAQELPDLPETIVTTLDGEALLTTWGKLIWNRVKGELLSGELLSLPYLSYLDSFHRDYQDCRNSKERIKLHETLVKVSSLLEKSLGDISPLKADGGILYEKYKDRGNIAHFRVTQGLRVSCHVENEQLILHRYGREPEVNTNPE
jgi:putative CRISPR-associated protein (TIGR02619 family)